MVGTILVLEVWICQSLLLYTIYYLTVLCTSVFNFYWFAFGCPPLNAAINVNNNNKNAAININNNNKNNNNANDT